MRRFGQRRHIGERAPKWGARLTTLTQVSAVC